MAQFDITSIERMLSDFAWHADRAEGDALSHLFTANGSLHVGGQELMGRQKIADDCHRRALDPARKVRHVWSNLRVDWIEDKLMRTTAVQLTFEQPGADAPAHVRVNDLFDTFALDEDGVWRFASRVIQREMALTL